MLGLTCQWVLKYTVMSISHPGTRNHIEYIISDPMAVGALPYVHAKWQEASFSVPPVQSVYSILRGTALLSSWVCDWKAYSLPAEAGMARDWRPAVLVNRTVRRNVLKPTGSRRAFIAGFIDRASNSLISLLPDSKFLHPLRSSFLGRFISLSIQFSRPFRGPRVVPRPLKNSVCIDVCGYGLLNLAVSARWLIERGEDICRLIAT